MSRILLAGLCPLPFEALEKNYAPGIRTWQFARALQEAGHEVLCVASRIPRVYPAGLAPVERSQPEPNLTLFRVDQPVFEEGVFLQRMHDEFRPDAIVAATIYPSAVCAKLTAWA